MGFYKLREWVWTGTGKGDRLGGRQVGRSEPAFRVASTTALLPPTCTARREAGQHLRLLFRREACAGRIVRRLCSPAAALFCRLCLPVHLCHAMTTAHVHQPPFYFALSPLFISMCARIAVQGCKDCPVGSYNTGLQWRPVRRFLTLSFSCRVH